MLKEQKSYTIFCIYTIAQNDSGVSLNRPWKVGTDRLQWWRYIFWLTGASDLKQECGSIIHRHTWSIENNQVDE